MSRSEKAALALIFITGSLVRLWDFPSYFPHFWDEALYVEEIDGLIKFFSVNVGSYAFLKLGSAIIGVPSYPQVVTAVAGLLTVLGLFLLGKRILSGESAGVRLGLMMAAQAAVMPWFVLYSRHALAVGFALCFFVFAFSAYLAKLQYPHVKNPRARLKYLRRSAAPAVLLAFVPACSFNFLLPTLILFVLLEIFIWRVRQAKGNEFKAGQSLAATLIAGGLLFILIPLILTVVSGYTGWLERAVTLSQFHAEIKTMRLAFNCLYPVHLYHLAGPLLMVCVLIGAVLTFIKPASNNAFTGSRAASVTMALGFAVYLLFYGMFSHLQSGRLYALTLPFTVYASSVAVLQSRHLVPRFSRIVVSTITVLLLVSMTAITIDYLSKSSNLPAASDELMKHLKKEGTIYANAKAQVYHCTFHSPYNTAGLYRLNSFIYTGNLKLSRDNPPTLVIQDGVDMVSTVASHDKEDELGSIDTVRTRLAGYLKVTGHADLIFAGAEDFYTSPYYYLEDVYSWRSYRYIRELMPRCRDSIFIYLANPARYGAPQSPP